MELADPIALSYKCYQDAYEKALTAAQLTPTPTNQTLSPYI